jgi:hypothetical protein
MVNKLEEGKIVFQQRIKNYKKWNYEEGGNMADYKYPLL